jgi:uncharacterized protein
MSVANWRGSMVAYIQAEALPIDKFGHQPRLYALACQIGEGIIGEGMSYDDDVVFAAAWLHDLGVFLGHRPSHPEELARWDHVPYTIAKSKELLAGWGFPAAKLDAVGEAIRTHQVNDNPTQIEGILLRDADILEQLGAMGALRALVKIGRDTRYSTFSSVLPVLRRAADELPEKLRLVKAKALAVGRVETLKGLISAIESEAGENLF